MADNADQNADLMAPEASPGAVSKRSGVRRVNNVPMVILGAVLLAFLVVMGLVASDRAAKQNAPMDAPKENAGNTAMYAKEIAGERTSGLVEAARPPSVPELPGYVAPPASGPLDVARPPNPDAPPLPPGQSGGNPGQPVNDEAQRIRTAKQQMFDEAVKAKTAVRVDAPRSSGSSVAAVPEPRNREEMLNRIASVQQQIDAQRVMDPAAAYQARLAQLQGGQGAMTNAPAGSGGTAASVSYAQFDQGREGDRWKLGSKPEAPRSPFELRAGFVIPATLLSGINSDLPGQIVGQVAQPVYDTPNGKHLLIPQGSRLVGAYSSEVKYGQARVLVAWQRIVFPDGKAMDIGSMPGADSAGYSGFSDQVNNHYLRIFGSALLMSGITAGVAITQDCANSSSGLQTGTSGKCAMTEALGQQLGMTTAALIAKNLNIAPTLEIRPGYRFNVIVTKDMTFSKPYKAFDY